MVDEIKNRDNIALMELLLTSSNSSSSESSGDETETHLNATKCFVVKRPKIENYGDVIKEYSDEELVSITANVYSNSKVTSLSIF